ncbi:hypothetical protein [Cohnella nanjingensis]|uniref:hypothetical protein n=1 Tax=Cohnella nanjingensis TaxID=1387779 RepID=UPI001C876EBF|nr:hypothetical protein [Cohnella nanjingensis]
MLMPFFNSMPSLSAGVVLLGFEAYSTGAAGKKIYQSFRKIYHFFCAGRRSTKKPFPGGKRFGEVR